MSNTITAYFKGRVGVAESIYQNDYGIVMAFDSIDLPAHFDCYFSRLNQEEALPGLGADNRVTIPNSILANPGNVTIHIPLHTGEDDSEVEYVIYFKVIGRARPIDDGTPAQMTAIERALALLSQPITNIEEIVNEALSFTGDTFAEMKQELADDFDNYTETLEGDLATWKGGVESDIDDVEADFTVLQGQFDAAVAAVTTDTEVTDIRVGADGTIADTAGSSVRRQIGAISVVKDVEEYHEVFSKYLDIAGVLQNGYAHLELSVSKGETYKIKAQTGSSIRTYVMVVNGAVVSYADGESWGTEHDYDVTYTVPNNGTLYINSIESSYIGVKKVTIVPSNQDDSDKSLQLIKDLSVHIQSNLFDKTEFLEGYRGNASIYAGSQYCYTKPIFLKAGTYLFTSSASTFGGQGDKVFIVDADGSYLSSFDGTSVGTKSESGKWDNQKFNKFTLGGDCYVSLNIGYKVNATLVTKLDNFMLAEGSSINDITSYKDYSGHYYYLNPSFINALSGLMYKSAVFDGDSICRGDSAYQDEDATTWGYAGRIVRANYMSWHNYGIGGGVITSASNPALSERHSVVDNIDAVHTAYPNADYIILEGGTNDADLLGDAIADPTVLGTYSPTDYSGTYDATTFSGALDTIFYKATNYWKGKHIGFIVAQKMGMYSSYDGQHSNRRAYFERAIEICKKWGIPYLDLWNDCYLNPQNPNLFLRGSSVHDNVVGGYLYIDGQHLSNKGYDYISPIIEDWMKSL